MRLDKPKVLAEDLEEIARLYDLSPIAAVKRLGGVPNVTFKVAVKSETLAIRICNNGYTSTEHLQSEVAVLDHLKRCGFDPSPKIKLGLNGDAIQSWRDYRVIAMHFKAGIPADRVDVTPALCGQVGQEVGRLKIALASYNGVFSESESFSSRTRRLLSVLPQAALELRWQIPTLMIASAFEDSIECFSRLFSPQHDSVVHTDVWPPNVLVLGSNISGIVDFDDMATAPPILDLSAVLTEFALTKTGHLRSAEAREILRGYCCVVGSISENELTGLVAGIKASCASWLACNALHRVAFEDSQAYLDKIQRLIQPDAEVKLRDELQSLLPS